MHLFLSPALLTLVLEQAPTAASPRTPSACPDRQRLELSQPAPLPSAEVCISPGNLTGFVFDQPASVDLQEEVRFGLVLRGRNGISFLPPPDLAAGERLRLTIHFEQDPPNQGVTLLLVSSPGQITHQVDVFHDARSRESLRREVEEERMKNHRLLEENRALVARFEAPVGLLKLFKSGVLGPWGVRSRTYSVEGPVSSGSFRVAHGDTYRSSESVGVKISVVNEDDEPWMIVGAAMSGSQGEELENVEFSGSMTVLPHAWGALFVEAKVGQDIPLKGLTVRIQGANERSVTVSNIPLP